MEAAMPVHKNRIILFLCIALVFAIAVSCSKSSTNKTIQADQTIMQEVEGNYLLELKVNATDSDPKFRLFFSANQDLSTMAFLDISKDSFKIGRKMDASTDVWKTNRYNSAFPLTVKILKKGNFFRFWINNSTDWIRGPLGEWEAKYEPWKSFVGLTTEADLPVNSFTLTTLPWLSQLGQPVIPKGPDGSFYEEQAIPGAVLFYRDTYYMYFMAGMKGDQEGSSRRSIGLATSPDLLNWKVLPEPVITYKDFPYDNLYVSGAQITPDNRIAVMFAAQQYPEWKGFFLAIADNPLGPFKPYSQKPVYKHYTHAHEFDLVQVDHPDYRYLMFYAGFTRKPPTGPVGDRGYLLYSKDLISWTPHANNPVFSPQTLDNWDAAHIRPRSLNRIGDTWYLWYEGCNNWVPPQAGHSGWWDSVGLARSKDLVHWEYYPLNPALPAMGADSEQFDNNWIGWPRMFVKDGVGYVFYTGGSPKKIGGVHIGLRTIPIEQLINWDSEGGETIDVLRNTNK
jgi:hypothetical protein